jgi:hypothetical protein
MIPLEKLIPIEQKAREYGYSTEIHDGGRYVKATVYKHGGRFTIVCDETGVTLWNPSTHDITIDGFKEFIEEMQRLLELAMMMQENIVTEDTEDTENEED